MQYRVLCSIIILLLVSCSAGNDFENKVKQSVSTQLQNYPQSTLQDLYKSFFQDKFGPGHMINDTAAARIYLDQELSSFHLLDTSNVIEIEPTGWEHNYYRVSLNVLKEGKVPYMPFFIAFVESVNTVVPPSHEAWRKEWASIETIIKSMNLQLPNYDADKLKIDSLLNIGKFAVHHSKTYEEVYSPHYRIVSKVVFERDLKRYFK